MELQEYRNKIDEIDRELVKLFCQRMTVVGDVAQYKKANSLPVLDTSREDALMKKIGELSNAELKDYTLDLYKSILRISKEYQEAILK